MHEDRIASLNESREPDLAPGCRHGPVRAPRKRKAPQREIEEPPPDPNDPPSPVDEPPPGPDKPHEIDEPPALRAMPDARRRALVETDIPARLDRLPWSRFHLLVIMALGVTWMLDGLEVTLAGALSGALKQSPMLHLTNTEIGLASSAYVAGAVGGAIVFGWMTDRLGRKRLFFITLAIYLTATAATALSWNFWSYALFRFITGAGIGGEYTAINSTIQELIPARLRGFTDLLINGSFWIGAAAGAAASIVLLDPHVIAPDLGWRLAFFIGATLGLVVFVMRMWIPGEPALADDPRPRRRGRARGARDRGAGVRDRLHARAACTVRRRACARGASPRSPRWRAPCSSPIGSAPWSACR